MTPPDVEAVSMDPLDPIKHPLRDEAERAWMAGYARQGILSYSKRPPSPFAQFLQGYVAGRAALLARLNEAEARANTATVAADLMRARAEKAERERDEAVGMLKEARGALEFYATGRRNAFRCASESIDLTKGTGPCCERVIDAGGIAQDALSRIDALTKARG